MSCRTTAGGRAASACATLLVKGSASQIPSVLHSLKRLEERTNPHAPQPSREEVLSVLHRMETRIRQDPSASNSRKERALSRVTSAIEAYQSGEEGLPDHATLQAWNALPAALEAERIVATPIHDPNQFSSSPEFMPGIDVVLPYHKAFSNLRPEIKTHTDALFRARPSRLSVDEAKGVFERWLSGASSVYGVEKPALIWDPSAVYAGGGIYYPKKQRIALSKPSITTLIHEFRHHLQHHGAPMINPDLEEDARAWSLSLYYAVRPNLLKKLVQQGRIFHISHADFD